MPKEHLVVSKEVTTAVYCDKCGAGLCSNSKWNIDCDTENPYIEVMIYPCEKCLQDSFDDGKLEVDEQ